MTHIKGDRSRAPHQQEDPDIYVHVIRRAQDTWQQPGEIQLPKGIRAIRTEEAKCTRRRFLVGADALFEFDNATLTPTPRSR